MYMHHKKWPCLDVFISITRGSIVKPCQDFSVPVCVTDCRQLIFQYSAAAFGDSQRVGSG